MLRVRVTVSISVPDCVNRNVAAIALHTAADGGSGNGPVLTVYAIDLILLPSFNQPVGPWFHLHASSDSFSYFGALSAYAKLRFSYRSFVVLRKSTVWLNRGVNC